MSADSAPSSGEQTACCVVGGGPAGAVLSLMLARRGVPVTLLEAQRNFEREFRGDSLNPAVMEIMEELGLADRLLQLPHCRSAQITLHTAQGPVMVTDLSRLRTRYPFVTVLPQARFLEFITTEAARHPNFKLLMQAPVQELIEEDGLVRGVRYREGGALRELRATLTVGADGRASQVRRLARLEPIDAPPSPFDNLWFRLPRAENDPPELNLSVRFGRGYYLALTDRFDYWQVAYVIPKGAYPRMRAAGLEAFRESIAVVAPELADRVEALAEWSQVRMLPGHMSRVPRWSRPGLLLIGDAAHVMSSVGGVGITCAIQDAVVTANVVGPALEGGRLEPAHLVTIQRRREWPVRMLQWLQRMSERQFVARALDPDRPFRVPLSLRLPFMDRLTAWVIASGLRPVHVDHTRGRAVGLQKRNDQDYK